MKKIQPLLLFLILVISSCKKNESNLLTINKNAIKFNKFPKEDNVNFSNLFEYKEGVPQEIHIIDSTLAISNERKGANYFLYNYSLKSNKLLKGYVAKGKGPFESIGGGKFGVLKDRIWFYDPSLFKVVFLDKKKFLINNTDSLYQEFNLKKEDTEEYYFYGSVAFIDSLNFLGIHKWGTSSKSKIEKVDLSLNKEIKGFGKYKEVWNNIDISTIRDAHSSSIGFNYKKNKALMAYRYSDVLEIYDINSGKCIATQGPENYDVYFTQDRMEQGKGSYYFMGKTKETKKTFVGSAFTDDFIYLIYSGHKPENRSESDRFKWQTGASIFVYDWNGNPVKKINLDRRINTIGVSNDNETIYSYDLNTGYLIKTNI